jgi:hypothetical protein
MPRTAPGSSWLEALASRTAAVAGVALSESDLALERALVGDLLLEVAGAELLLVEELEAGLAGGAAVEAGAGEGDPRLRGLRLLDRERGAVVAQLVGDPLRVERGRDLAGLGGIEAGADERVARAPGDLHAEEDERDERRRAADEHEAAARGEVREQSGGSGHGLHLCVEDVLDGVDGLRADL